MSAVEPLFQEGQATMKNDGSVLRRGVTGRMAVSTAGCGALLLILLGTACATPRAGDPPQAPAPAPGERPASATAVQRIQSEATALEEFAGSRMAREFLAATSGLPEIAPRTLHRDGQGRYYSAAEFAALPEAQRAGLTAVKATDQVYYTTRYGSPMTYTRPLDVLAGSGFKSMKGQKVLDFGYGYIGHLRLWAMMGADVTGVEVDDLLRALYSDPGDQGAMRGPRGRSGQLRLLHGQYPADSATAEAVGQGYDLIISKNVLKNGYIHPERPVDPRRLVHLGVDDATFVRTLHAALAPGGLLLIYNISPAPNPPDKEYIPWADGRCPFPREMLEESGFQVLAYNQDDSAAVREMGSLLGWDRGEQPMDLNNNLFAEYTLARRPK